MTSEANSPEGHRERLRQRFRQDPAALSDAERIELVLTYAIPRRDVAPLAIELLARFGSLQEVLAAPFTALTQVEGVGESTALFIQLIHHLIVTSDSQADMSHKQPSPQLNLFELEPKPAVKELPVVRQRPMRVFANDEVANSLTFLPQAANFSNLEDFKTLLIDRLPYNAADTRTRRANYILERFFSEGSLDTPLTFFAAHCSTQADLKPAVFYHIINAEPIAAKVTEELIWSALPIGRVDREQIREFILRYLPDTRVASQAKILQAIFHTYDLLGVGTAYGDELRFQLHSGTLESFFYLLTSQFPQPGIYSFESLYAGPLHRWLLWDREWMRRQLYNLQDFGILSKVSEIDTVRQFTLAMDQPTSLRAFFEHPQRSSLAVRETGGSQDESATT
jgi:hypothetical protein